MKKTLFLFLFFAAFSLLKAQTQEQVQSIPLGYHQHDGFYLSMSIGPVFGKITDDIKDNYKMDFTGTGAQFDFKIGGRIGENLILHASMISSSISGPTISISDRSVKVPDDYSIGETMMGVGVTYYFMPSNFFLSGSLGLGNFSLVSTEDDINVSTKKGFSMQLKVGKEWWISKNWGFGIGLTYGKTNLTNKSDGVEEKMDSNRFGILFNTTFN
jgi:hypothetical protein